MVYVKYTKGLSTATETEIVSTELQPDDQIIVGRVGQSTSSAATQARRRGPGPM